MGCVAISYKSSTMIAKEITKHLFKSLYNSTLEEAFSDRP